MTDTTKQHEQTIEELKKLFADTWPKLSHWKRFRVVVAMSWRIALCLSLFALIPAAVISVFGLGFRLFRVAAGL